MYHCQSANALYYLTNYNLSFPHRLRMLVESSGGGGGSGSDRGGGGGGGGLGGEAKTTNGVTGTGGKGGVGSMSGGMKTSNGNKSIIGVNVKGGTGGGMGGCSKSPLAAIATAAASPCSPPQPATPAKNSLENQLMYTPPHVLIRSISSLSQHSLRPVTPESDQVRISEAGSWGRRQGRKESKEN